jgi:hypothetical protein
MCGIFLLKFSTEMLIRTMNGTLTHNVKYMVCSHHKKLQSKTNVELAIHYIHCCMPLILIR